ncbi:MAG TPA: PKD domain-containing protein, partial [Myxococcota bacterium]|nr:PKD domain-containing protein [Myxococcota bacterium]
MKVRTHSGAALALVTLLGLLGAAPGARAVDYSGTLNSNTTWSAGDVVVVTGDLSVAPGITLTVNEGALVQVRGAYRLTVNGTLEVNGSQAAPAVFQPENAGAARGAWVGLVVEAGATVDLEHAILRKAQWGLQVNGLTASPVGVRQPEFSECSLGAVNVVSGAGARSATLDAVRVHHNGTNSGSSALYVGNGESLTVQNGLFYANTGNGLESYYGTLTATNCTVHGQTAYGLYLWYGTATVKNCIVSANSSNGIYTNGTSYSASYNDVWGNGNNGNAGSSSISANPLFVDAAGYDFGLTHRSPGRKLGEGGTWQGALEWAGAQTVGNLGYVWEDLTIPAGDFVIAGDFTVAPGVTLTVDPGAVLKFAAVDAMGSNDALAELRVEGTLNADGTLGEPIELRPESDGAARGSWTGVVALPGASFTLDSAVIRKAKVGLSCEAAGALVTQTEIADCTQNAVNVVSGAGARSATLDAVRVHHNGTNSGSSALYVGNGESLTVQNGLFYANTGNGLESYYGTLTATNCTVHGQTAYGLYLWYGTATVKNCIVSANSSNGIYTNGTSYSASYNDVWGNGNNGNAGSSSITEDPMFVNVVEPNLHLLDSSPCIDTGTATGAPDHDLEGQPRPLQGREVGSPIHDMGAYEFDRTSNRYPVADAGADRTVVKDAPVQFDGSPSVDPDGSVVAWAWDFGDGQLGSGATPIHTYATAGTYQVTLVVTDDGGLTGSDRASIHVNTRPTAAAGPDKNAAVNETVYFDASGSADVDGSLVGFLWDFGDGQTATTSFASHRYASSGLYTATLTVTDDDGASASDTARVTVGDPADTTGPVVIHTQVPDGQPDGVDVAVVATISDESGVRSASLYYRPTGQPGFSAAPMVVVAGSQYAGLIPAAAVTTAGVDYYLEAEDDSPAHNPSLSPAG